MNRLTYFFVTLLMVAISMHSYGAYWEHLEHRRNIPKTEEEYKAKRNTAFEYVHQAELLAPGKTQAYRDLQNVLLNGWGNSWCQRSPGWTDLMLISSPFIAVIALITIGIAFEPPEERARRLAGRRGAQ